MHNDLLQKISNVVVVVFVATVVVGLVLLLLLLVIVIVIIIVFFLNENTKSTTNKNQFDSFSCYRKWTIRNTKLLEKISVIVVDDAVVKTAFN